MTERVFVGISGKVICLDTASGQILWLTRLKGSDFVNILVDEGRVMATARGEVFCLDAATGHLLWQNPLKGQGFGLATLATSGGAMSQSPLLEKQRREAAKQSAG
jgi:outer membrane protein assembly factor BamB